MVEGANILLAYFHYCNKGIYPFSGECKEQDLRTLAELDDDKMTFVKETRAYALKYRTCCPHLQKAPGAATSHSPCPPHASSVVLTRAIGMTNEAANLSCRTIMAETGAGRAVRARPFLR
jgi:hypothetical protein